jgi:hypothetical protein
MLIYVATPEFMYVRKLIICNANYLHPVFDTNEVADEYQEFKFYL